jgi:septum formation protein
LISLRFVLASASPRRRELLAAEGLQFETDSPQAEEMDDEGLGAAGLVLANARTKAFAVASRRRREIVLGADTIVWLDGKALGKPPDPATARTMLATLAGRTHEVVTGVCLVRLEPLQQVEFHEATRVRFRPLDAATIDRYLAAVDVMDKAGAYALQESGEMLVEAVEGSRTNVIGLPVARTLAALRRFAEGLT